MSGITTRHRSAAGALAALCLAAVVSLSGCAAIGFGGAGSVELRAFETGAVLSPGWRTAVFTSDDPNSANIYLSDLSLDAITTTAPESLDAVAGNILHVRMFIRPRAGQTPIDFDASNITIRHIVLAPGAMGVYGGGGFLLPSGSPEGRSFGGRIRRATLRLTEASIAFSDRLGPVELSGRINATRDDDAAQAVARTISGLLARREARPVDAPALAPSGESPTSP
ncbi:MAG: hypothetical protein EA379_02400 [Phycisphaerales bacterium]|nr:MAG: hypothetical protein EA379_02400 [Phycisphaerales bacterium]